MTGSTNDHEGSNEASQSKKEDIPKPTSRLKIQKLVSIFLERLKKIGKGGQRSMYTLLSYVQ